MTNGYKEIIVTTIEGLLWLQVFVMRIGIMYINTILPLSTIYELHLKMLTKL